MSVTMSVLVIGRPGVLSAETVVDAPRALIRPVFSCDQVSVQRLDDRSGRSDVIGGVAVATDQAVGDRVRQRCARCDRRVDVGDGIDDLGLARRDPAVRVRH